MPLSVNRLPDAYRQMLIIRKFEEAIRDLYQNGRFAAHSILVWVRKPQRSAAVGRCARKIT